MFLDNKSMTFKISFLTLIENGAIVICF